MPDPAGETIDSIIFPDLRVIQGRDGYRFSLDSLLLFGFAEPFLAGPVIDLGCGTGILAFLTARLHPECFTVGLELQAPMARRARDGALLNGLSPRLGIVRGDIRDAARLFGPGAFATVLSNPPYRRAGSGRLPAHDERVIARHDRHCAARELLAAAGHLLASGGRCFLSWLPGRLDELTSAAADAGLAPDMILPVSSRPTGAPYLFLLRLVHGHPEECLPLPALAVRQGDAYTPAVSRLLATGTLPVHSFAPPCVPPAPGV